MKDTVITGKRKKTELLTFGICFILANLLNLYSIIAYDTSFIELFSSLGYVTITATGLYVAWSGIRLLYYFIRNLLNNKKTK